MIKHPLYIKAACAISPQHSFGDTPILDPVVQSENNRLIALDVDYRAFINPVAIRRMSRLLKMSISAAIKCLQNAGVSMPDAIITGTGRGSAGDMQHFLKDMILMKEEALNPTFFIQSTYNAPNGWIALQSKSTGYNQTFVHRGISLELALLDAQLLLAEAGDHQNILIGCYDETTADYFVVKEKLNYWKKETIPSEHLYRNNETLGSIAGEGAAFFAVSGEKEGAVCSIASLEVIHQPAPTMIRNKVQEVLAANGLTTDDIDVVICGRSGDVRFEAWYGVLEDFATQTIAGFKHLCGEYETSSGFALWLAHQIFAQGTVPECTVLQKGDRKEIRHMLIINHFILDTVSVMLLKSLR